MSIPLPQISPRVKRLDFIPIPSVTVTGSGALAIPANLTRVGVLEYRREDGSISRELRPPDEVFSPESLDSLRGAVVTDLHGTSLVTPQSWRSMSIGHVGDDVREDGQYIAGTVRIQEAGAIAAVKKKDRQELSPGYTCVLDPVAGEFNGQRYDSVQRQIRYNHVAIGPSGWGRSGPQVSLRLDGGGNQLPPPLSINSPEPVMTQRMIRIDGADYEFGSNAHVAKIEALAQTRIDAATAARDTASGERDAAKKEVTELTARLDAAMAPAAMDARVMARVKLVAGAKALAGENIVVAGVPDRDLMVSAIRADDASFVAEGHSDDYVRAFFDAKSSAAIAAKSAVTAGSGRAGLAPQAQPQQRVDGAPTTAADAHAGMLAYHQSMSNRQPGAPS